jgi:potassium-dependent mechanosensitive channel
VDQLEAILRYPLVRLAQGPLTLGAILVGLALVMATWLLSRGVAHAVQRLLSARGLSEGALFAISRILQYTVQVTGVLVAISTMGLDVTAVLAASTVLLVGLGFGLQNITQNFISGLIVLIEQPVRKGDFIRVGGAYGTVLDIGLRATRVLTRDQVMIIVPNAELVSTQVVNHSQPTPNLRIRVNVGVAYGSDTARVKQVLLTTAKAHPLILQTPEPLVRFEDFGESSLDFSLIVWISDPASDLHIASELRFAIDQGFRDNGIQIPFPQRDLHVRSGLEKLLAR